MLLKSKSRLLVILSLILITGFSLVSILNVSTARSAMLDELSTSSLPLLRENILSEIRTDFIPALNTASVMANDYFLIKWTENGEIDEKEIRSYLKRIQQKYGFYSTFFVSNNSKIYYHHSGINKIVSKQNSHDVWYFDFIKSGKKYALDVDTDEAGDDKLTIFFNFRIENNKGDLIGVTGVGVEMEGFSEFLLEKQKKYNRAIFLTDSEGTIQAHSDISMIEHDNITDTPGFDNIAEEILSNKTSAVDLRSRSDGETILISSRYIPELDWFLIVELSESEDIGGSRTILSRSVIIGLLFSLSVIIIVSLMITSYNRRLEALAVTDPLTGVANRRDFERQLKLAVYRNRRYRVPVSLLLIDIDNFKRINDTGGHSAGDKILVELTGEIQRILRPDDLLARLGGDEFVVLIEAETKDALSLAERIRCGVSEKLAPVTLSIGAAELKNGESSADFIKRADKAMYRAKADGRNRTVSE